MKGDFKTRVEATNTTHNSEIYVDATDINITLNVRAT